MKQSKKRNENKVNYGTISLPLPLVKKIKKRIKGTGMASVSAYVSFVLREILSSTSSVSKSFSKKEIEEVKKRLKNLGY